MTPQEFEKKFLKSHVDKVRFEDDLRNYSTPRIVLLYIPVRSRGL